MAAEWVPESVGRQFFGRPDFERPVYFISGHGSEHPGTFKIPLGCVIIVKNTTCTFAHSQELNEMLNGLLFLSEKVVRNPIGNMNDIIQILGSVGVYSRDQPRINEHPEYFRYHRPTPNTCVNLRYHLLNVIFNQDQHGKRVTIDDRTGSGILDLSRIRHARRGIDYVNHRRSVIYAPDTPRGIQAAHRNKNRNIEYIKHLYRHSIYPTAHTIEVYVSTRWREETEVELYDMLHDLDKQRYLIDISQEDLCLLFPGVYYHNVCRGIESAVNASGKNYVKHWNNWKKGETERKVLNLASNPVFERAFTEAELRRNYLHQYQGSRAFEEAQHVMNGKNCRNLEERISKIEERIAAVNQSNASNEVKTREKNKIIKNTRVRLLRNILYDKQTKRARREAMAREAIARAAARRASILAAERAAVSAAFSHRRNHTRNNRARGNRSRNRSRSRSRSPTQNNRKNNN